MIAGRTGISRPAARSAFGRMGSVCQARMEPGAECILVIIGAMPEGRKELPGFHVGVRESGQSLLSGFAGKPLPVDGTGIAYRYQGP